MDYQNFLCEKQIKIVPTGIEVSKKDINNSLFDFQNDIVLSPFAGIGSEGYQAVKMGRRFVGIELKGSYYQQAVRNLYRVEQENKMQQVSIF